MRITHLARLLGLLAVLALVFVPAGASAHKKGKHRTINYKTTLSFAGAEGDYLASAGRAKLQDHRKKDRLWIKLKGVQPGDVYTARLFEGTCDERGDEVTGWTVKNPLNAGPKGNASGRLDNRTFVRDKESPYAVVVYTPEGEELACGTFKAKKKPKKAKGKAKGKKQRS